MRIPILALLSGRSRNGDCLLPFFQVTRVAGQTRYPVGYVNRAGEPQYDEIADIASPSARKPSVSPLSFRPIVPTESLLQLIAALAEKPIPAIVLVDDGSGPDYREIFSRAAEFAKVRLVAHAVNLGKGAALKTGINYAMCAFPELQGVITADADGQHHPDDIERVADRLASEPDRVILGTRTFSAGIPLRSLSAIW